ncbi:hypothetical protein EYF80_045437 [Liparis tanakae]|uniref:Uncharacterized protein n=1 Tax=Liparis tanakae TaxID=230148 RepID=A0A4Z2FTL0_9TELE|nr:hypothetical protein EYF80_045437 [Liparis tanakae]
MPPKPRNMFVLKAEGVRGADAASRKPAAERACDPDEDAAECAVNLAPRAAIPRDTGDAVRGAGAAPETRFNAFLKKPT